MMVTRTQNSCARYYYSFDMYRKVMMGDAAKVYKEKDKNLREIVLL